MNELSSYVFSLLRDGDMALYRGSGNGLAPILAVAAEETLRGCVERLEHEHALKAELDAEWAARPVDALQRPHDAGAGRSRRCAARPAAWPATGRVAFPSHRDPSRGGTPPRA